MNNRTPHPPHKGAAAHRLRAVAGGLAAWLALAGAAAAAAPGRVGTAAAAPLRLAADVQPQAYRLHIDLDPERPEHRGEVQIDLRLARPQPAPGALRLHAKDLRLDAVWLELGAQRLAGRVRRLDAEQVELRFGRALPAGPARLVLGFGGRLQDRDVDGLFRQREGGRWAAYTQFQPTGARLAFPLFDEPGFKVPWTLSLGVPADLVALANTEVASEEADGPGRKRVQFRTTPPLPSYLLAFAVGDFALRELAPGPADPAVPMRVVTPRGRADEADDAARIQGPVLQALADWFAQPYPYAKLDSLAIPLTSGFEAMEHPGLVTYASRVLLARPEARTPDFELALLATTAHELAHQWFGNLVTPAWWDDLWLNESFASWLGDKVSAALRPDLLRADDSAQHARRRALQADRLPGARSVQQVVAREEAMAHLFNPITYEKGQAVLGMFEAWLGPQRFQAGVRRYIARHAWGLASSADFYAALGEEDPALPDALRSFTTQPGIPRLQVRLHCGDGPPRLELAQSRLLPLGAPATAAAAAQRWQLPLRLRTPEGDWRLLMTGPQATLTLAPPPAAAGTASAPPPDDPAAAPCPAWVQANADGLGYWRSAYADDGALRLARSGALGAGEWLALLDDAQGLHESGDLDSTTALALVHEAAAQADARVVGQAARLLAHLAPLLAALPDGHGAARAAYAARWQADFGARAQALGWLPRPGEDSDTRRLRARLLPLLGRWGADDAPRAQALGLTRAWLADRAALPAEVRGEVLATAARQGDAALFDALAAALRQGSDRHERQDLLAALGRFRHPGLPGRALGLLLGPELDPREALWPLLGGLAEDSAGRAEAMDFLQRHRAALAARLGRHEPGWWPEAFTGACSPAEAARLEAVFAPHAARHAGGAESLAQAREAVQLCSAWAARQAAGLAAALAP